MFQGYVLSLTIWVPIGVGIAVLAMGNDSKPMPARWTALAGSALGFAVCIPLWTGFLPIADMLPTWTGCTAAVVMLRRKAQAQPPPLPMKMAKVTETPPGNP